MNSDLKYRNFIIQLTTAEELSNDALIKEKEEHEKLKNKIFIVENAIIKKDNIILGLKKKLDKYLEFEEGRSTNYFEKEIILTEPSIAINHLHDELILYKNCYENLSMHFKQNKTSLLKFESIINVIYKKKFYKFIFQNFFITFF